MFKVPLMHWLAGGWATLASVISSAEQSVDIVTEVLIALVTAPFFRITQSGFMYASGLLVGLVNLALSVLQAFWSD